MSHPLLLQMWTSYSSSASRSLSSYFSPSPYTTINTAATTANLRIPQTMEEVWKDFTLAVDLHHPQSSHEGVILKDFFSKDPPTASVSSSGFSVPPPPMHPTMLSLRSGPDHSSLLLEPHQQIQPIPHASIAFEAAVPDDNTTGGKQRFSEFDRSSCDRRNKRMIKNRESAARSRARKQAYTNELELELTHLLEENARLKKQQKQLYRAAAAAEHQKKKALHRTSTAPF